jgi:membrane protein CcdC involved in cytochrome C biogenesis
MTLTEAQKGLVAVGDVLLTISFSFLLFSHVHRDEHGEKEFVNRLKGAGAIAILGMLLCMSAVVSKQRTAKKQVSINNIIFALFSIGLYTWSVMWSKDPVVSTSISILLAVVLGISFNVIVLKKDNEGFRNPWGRKEWSGDVVENSPDLTHLDQRPQENLYFNEHELYEEDPLELNFRSVSGR